MRNPTCLILLLSVFVQADEPRKSASMIIMGRKPETVTMNQIKYHRGVLPVTDHAICQLREEKSLVVFPCFSAFVARKIKAGTLRKSIVVVGSLEFGEVRPEVNNPKYYSDYQVEAPNDFYDVEIRYIPSEDPRWKGHNHYRFVGKGKFHSLGEVIAEINFSRTSDKSFLRVKQTAGNSKPDERIFELDCRYRLVTEVSGNFPTEEALSTEDGVRRFLRFPPYDKSPR